MAAKSFETNFKELQGIVEKMEHDPGSLKELLKNFEKASLLYTKCVDELKEAEQKVTIVRETHFGTVEDVFEGAMDDEL